MIRLLQSALKSKLTPQILECMKSHVKAIGYTTFYIEEPFDALSRKGMSAASEIEFLLRGLNMLDLSDDEIFVQANKDGTHIIGSGWAHNKDYLAKLLFAIKHCSATLQEIKFKLIVQDTWVIQVYEFVNGDCTDLHVSDGTVRSFATVAKNHAGKDADDIFEHIHMSFSEKTEEEYEEAGMDDIYDWIRLNNFEDLFPNHKSKYDPILVQVKT